MITDLGPASPPRPRRTEDWVPREVPSRPNRRLDKRAPAAAESSGRAATNLDPTPRGDGGGTEAEALEKVEERLRRIEASLRSMRSAMGKHLEELDTRLKSLESTATRGSTRGTAKRGSANGSGAKRVRKARTAPNAKGRKGKRDLNAATFEQLRELGLSITQSAKLVATRETRGGFGSLDELDSLKGFSAASLVTLRSEFRV